MGPARGATLTLLLKVQQPIQQDQGLHQRGQQQCQAEEGYHAVLLGLVGPQGSRVQGQLGVQPNELQPPPDVSVGSARQHCLVRGAAFSHAQQSLPASASPIPSLHLHFRHFPGCELSVQQQIDPKNYSQLDLPTGLAICLAF